jgi:DNA-directed RNA polymerase specialized sigma24 family protein
VAEGNDIEGFYPLHSDSVYSYLVSLCRDRSRAEDLMQDTFVRATRALGGYPRRQSQSLALLGSPVRVARVLVHRARQRFRVAYEEDS